MRKKWRARKSEKEREILKKKYREILLICFSYFGRCFGYSRCCHRFCPGFFDLGADPWLICHGVGDWWRRCVLAKPRAPKIVSRDKLDVERTRGNAAQWVETEWNQRIKFIVKIQKPLSHELQSEWVSERANEWALRSARAKQAVRSKRMGEKRSEWPCILCVDFVVILPNVHIRARKERKGKKLNGRAGQV